MVFIVAASAVASVVVVSAASAVSAVASVVVASTASAVAPFVVFLAVGSCAVVFRCLLSTVFAIFFY